MSTKMILGLACALWLSPMAAGAQTRDAAIEQRLTAEQMHATGLDTLSPAQLALLNRLLADEAAAADVARPPQRDATGGADATTANGAAAAADVGRGDAPRAEQARGHGSFVGLEDGPIRSRLKGSVSSWEPGTEFTLENGQVWKVLKGSATLRKTLVAPEVIVVPGVAGRWFLQVDEDVGKPRVYRID